MAFRINTVTIDGNLTRDPEVRAVGSDSTVCQLRIAHNSRRKNRSTGQWEDVPHYFDVTFWGGEGDWIARNLGRGDKIVVQGELRWREWETQSGEKRQAVDINGIGIIPVPKNGGGGGGGGGGQRGGGDFRAQDSDFSPPVGGGGGFSGPQGGDGGFQAQPQTQRTQQGPPPDDDIPF